MPGAQGPSSVMTWLIDSHLLYTLLTVAMVGKEGLCLGFAAILPETGLSGRHASPFPLSNLPYSPRSRRPLGGPGREGSKLASSFSM